MEGIIGNRQAAETGPGADRHRLVRSTRNSEIGCPGAPRGKTQPTELAHTGNPPAEVAGDGIAQPTSVWRGPYFDARAGVWTPPPGLPLARNGGPLVGTPARPGWREMAAVGTLAPPGWRENGGRAWRPRAAPVRPDAEKSPPLVYDRSSRKFSCRTRC